MFSSLPEHVVEVNDYILKPIKWQPFIDNIEIKCVVRQLLTCKLFTSFFPVQCVFSTLFLHTSVSIRNTSNLQTRYLLASYASLEEQLYNSKRVYQSKYMI